MSERENGMDVALATQEASGENQGVMREANAGALQVELDGLRETLARAREALDQAERRHQIDLELLKADAVDLETARLMTDAAVAGMKDADVARAVADLRKRKPFLFRRVSTPPATGAMAPNPNGRGGAFDAESLAHEARSTGDRRSLLRYLRARRAA